MCLAVPGRILEIVVTTEGVRLARVDFGGPVKTVNLTFLPAARSGDFVIAHAGFATQILSEPEAREAIELGRRLRGATEGGPSGPEASVVEG